MKSTFFLAATSSLILLPVLYRLLCAYSMTSDKIELPGFTGPLATSISCNWITVDVAADHFSHATKTQGDELKLSTDLLLPFVSSKDPLPHFFSGNHSQNFV